MCRVLIAGFLMVCVAAQAHALGRVSFATNCLAEAEHGGLPSVVDGTYERYGLKVRIVQSGPQANNQLLLAAGRVDFYLGANMIQALHAVEQGIPTLVVASLFQKDPLILMWHPGVGLERFDHLPRPCLPHHRGRLSPEHSAHVCRARLYRPLALISRLALRRWHDSARARPM